MYGSRFRFQVPVPVSLYRCIAVSLFSSSLKNGNYYLDVIYSILSLTNGRGSRVAGKKSRVAGKISRVQSRVSRVKCRGSRVKSRGSLQTVYFIVSRVELLLFKILYTR